MKEFTKSVSNIPAADDNLLLKQVQSGNTDAFDELLKRYYSSVYNMVSHSVREQHDREDLIQDIFIKVYRSINNFRFEASFSTWLFRITQNMLIDRSRKRKIMPISMDYEEDGKKIGDQIEGINGNPEKKLIDSDADTILRNALTQLNEEHKHILILREMEGLSYKELTHVLKINMGTVKSRLARAREELKIVLTGMESG